MIPTLDNIGTSTFPMIELMNNRNDFQKLAKRFRSGGLSLSEFTDNVFSERNSRNHINDQVADFRMPVRPTNSHKGDFGRALFIGGCETMPGAIALSAITALKTGAWLATVMTPMEAWPIVASFSPCLMTVGCKSWNGYFSDGCLEAILQQCERADVVAIGPGMGRVPVCRPIVGTLYRELKTPMVVDADAINNLVDARADFSKHAGPRVLTPHEGEFCRITDVNHERRSDLEQDAIEFARRNQTVVVLKGPQTLVTDGEKSYHNESGNEGMATAGSGDVLTGVIASFIGQKVEPYDAAKSSCYLHGMAGDIYVEESAAATLVATDLIEFMEVAMTRLTGKDAGSW